jgi:hypothetical protein
VNGHDDREAAGLALRQPGLAVHGVDRDVVPDRRGVQHGVVVDLGDGGRIGRHGMAHAQGQGVVGHGAIVRATRRSPRLQ